MPRFLISYDITAPRLRSKVVSRLEKLGTRLQLSVFMVKCGDGVFAQLERELLNIIDKEDSLLILPVCEHCYAKGAFTGPTVPILIVK